MLPSDWLKQLQKEYPKRAGGQGWGYVKKLVPKIIADGTTWDELLDGVRGYAALKRVLGEERTPYVMQARTFFGPGEWWAEEYELPGDGTPEKLSIDQVAQQEGLRRQDGESDDELRRRVGVAQTKKMYKL